MPLIERTYQIIAGVLSLLIFGTPVIGVNYNSPFYTHLVDVTSGNITNTDIETNAPNWGFAEQLPQVQGVTATATSTGTLATSTVYSFAVAALDQTGTTTLSGISTAISSSTASGAIDLTWALVPGAQGYAIYFATGTVSTATGLTQYFLATTTSYYWFATSTGSLSGSYTKTDTSAFSDIIQPNGPSYIEGDNGTATGSPVAASGTALEINGGLRVTEVGTTTSCDAQTAGAEFYNTANSHEWGCNGSAWVKIF